MVRGNFPHRILDELVVAPGAIGWSSGPVAGTEVEHLSPALIQPKRECSNCHGYGVLRYLTAAEVTPPTCMRCGGTGTVPTGAIQAVACAERIPVSCDEAGGCHVLQPHPVDSAFDCSIELLDVTQGNTSFLIADRTDGPRSTIGRRATRWCVLARVGAELDPAHGIAPRIVVIVASASVVRALWTG